VNLYRTWRAPMQDFRQFGEAWGRIDEATTTLEKTKERWCEVDVRRTTGGIFWIQTTPEEHRGVAGYVQKKFMAPTVACDCRLAVPQTSGNYLIRRGGAVSTWRRRLAIDQRHEPQGVRFCGGEPPPSATSVARNRGTEWLQEASPPAHNCIVGRIFMESAEYKGCGARRTVARRSKARPRSCRCLALFSRSKKFSCGIKPFVA
jgi:hypothetical protein